MQNLSFRVFSALTAGCLLIASCYSNKEDLLYGDDVCDTTEVSFDNHIAPIIANRCAFSGCHVQGGASPVMLENYAQIKASVDNGSFVEQVLETREMPPDGPLTDCQIEFIRTWIELGAPNN